jgi:hypothetical protein
MKNKGVFIAILIVAFLGVAGILMYYSYSNKYITLKNLYEAQVEDDKNIFDEVWKVIKGQAGVSEQYATKFKENYQAIMSARNYGGEMMKWITEANPNFTPEMYVKLQSTIEAQRAKFATAQRKMISYHMEIKNAVQLFPGSLFIGNREIPELKLVTSTKTENAFQTGKDDDSDPFSK